MKRRVLWISIVALLGVQACASVKPLPQIVRRLEVDSAFVDFFAEQREILPTELVLCLYGNVSGDTAWISFIKPARMRERTRFKARYDDCPQSKLVQFLGTWHQHNVPEWNDDLCRFSDTDNASFMEDKRNIVELLSCKGKLMARSKYK